MSTPFLDRYGPWAVVAGASEGLGEAFADALAARGSNLVLVARRADALSAVVERLTRQRGVEVRAVVADLGHPELAEVLRRATADLEVGFAVYNAAASFTGPLLASPLERALGVVDVNVRGPLVFTHALVPPMVARRRGGLLLMSSLAGLQGSPNLAAYAASKAFTTVLGQSLWAELGPSGIDVLVSCAGAIRTPNYRKASRKDAPGTLDPREVAESSLGALGRGPLFIPGVVNRLAAFLLTRVLSRRGALALLGSSTKAALQGVP